jgi:hypothetical protein
MWRSIQTAKTGKSITRVIGRARPTNAVVLIAREWVEPAKAPLPEIRSIRRTTGVEGAG